MLMFKQDGGFHNFAPHEIEQATKDGWIDGEPIRQAALAAKRAAVAKPAEPVKLTVQSEPKRAAGRPRKELPSFLTGATNGNSSDTD